MNGYIVNKAEEAQNYGVNERSIQRDIEDIRSYMDKESTETGTINTVVYDSMKAVVDILFLTLGGAEKIDDKLPPKWWEYRKRKSIKMKIYKLEQNKNGDYP
jgi:hypothetical protein